MLSNTVLALSLLPFALAHFELTYPKSRGFSDDQESNFPCGGFNHVQQERTDFAISGGPITIKLGHQQTNVAVYMAIGDNPGDGFSIVAHPQIMLTGLGDFCFGSVGVPEGINVTDGTKASIQVVSNNHESGGLYQCADVTLVNTQLSSSDFSTNCKNGSTSISQENISGNPNGTSSDSHASPSATPSSSAATPASSTGAAAQAKAVSWVLGAVGLAGMAML